MKDKKLAYVFVVCGSQEHTDTLHYSLKALQNFSRERIIVVTDISRNEQPIHHSDVIDVKTPIEYNHHQASIFLKTGLSHFLPKGCLYCYLDTDVVAVNANVDLVFNQYVTPITFAPDHCTIDQFSPHAVTCNCAKQHKDWEDELKSLLIKYKDVKREPENAEKKERLLQILERTKNNYWQHKLLALRFNLSRNIFKLDNDTFLDKKKEFWHDKDKNPILYEKHIKSSVELIEEHTDFRYSKALENTWTIYGKDVFDCRCAHLREAIFKTFNINITNEKWQHWNGGVFLFDDDSFDFMNMWHQKSLAIFQSVDWKTRDQGTLIATAWAFNLQNHPTLHPSFNLLADYLHQNIEHIGNLTFLLKNTQVKIQPAFVHVYHHWADIDWDVWQEIQRATNIEIDEDANTFNSLWIGNTISKLELLTIESFLAKGHRFKLWLYEPLKTKLPDTVIIGNASEIVPKESIFAYTQANKYGHGKGSYAGFSDIFRYKLLYEKGGWWIDMDVTCLKRFDFVKPYFFRNHHDLKVVGNVMKCPKHSLLMQFCYEEAAKTVNADNTDWHKPISILNRHIAALNLDSFIHFNISNEDKWDITSKYIWQNEPIPEHWYFIHWQNEEWRSKKVKKSGFLYKTTLASLMDMHNLFKRPNTFTEKLINRLRYGNYY